MEFIKVNTDPFGEELLVSEIDIEEHDAIKVEPKEDTLHPLQDCSEEIDALNKDVEPPNLPECHVLIKKLLECDSCRFFTDKKTKLRTHMKSHLKPTIESTKCRRKSTKNDDNESQPVYVGKILNYHKCEQCDIKYFNPDMLAWHTAYCHGLKAIVKVEKCTNFDGYMYQCVQCIDDFPCRFNEFVNVTQHLCIHHKAVNLPFHCNVCNEHFKHENDLRRHRIELSCKNVTEKNGAQCAICDKFLKSELHMKKHILKFHDTSKTYSHFKIRRGLHLNCKHCEKPFICYEHLCKHCRARHPEKSLLLCHICNNNYISDIGCMNNKTEGLYEFGIFCFFCFSGFRSPNSLKAHIDTVHSALLKNPTMTCDLCSKSDDFACEVDYHRHRQHIHTRSHFYCAHCAYDTSRKRNITWHILHRHL